jgi:hypothetical protein
MLILVFPLLVQVLLHLLLPELLLRLQVLQELPLVLLQVLRHRQQFSCHFDNLS